MADVTHDDTSGWQWFWSAVLWVVTCFYLYGAAVHVANISSAMGFEWLDAPRKWQILDVVYLILDLIVIAGLWTLASVSVLAFYVASVSQVVLYTAGRSWIMNVPEEVQTSAAVSAYLDLLIAFHVIAMVLVTAAILALGRRQASSQTM